MNVMRQLDDRQEAPRPVDEPVDASGALVALVDQLLEAAPADRHERDLGGHEEAVDEDQDTR